MPPGTEADFGPGGIVLDEDPAPPPKKKVGRGTAPLILAHLLIKMPLDTG